MQRRKDQRKHHHQLEAAKYFYVGAKYVFQFDLSTDGFAKIKS